MKKLERMDGRLFEKLALNEFATMFNIVGGTKSPTTYKSSGTSVPDCKDDSTQDVTTREGKKFDIIKDVTCSPQQLSAHANSVGVAGENFASTADSVEPWYDFECNSSMTINQ